MPARISARPANRRGKAWPSGTSGASMTPSGGEQLGQRVGVPGHRAGPDVPLEDLLWVGGHAGSSSLGSVESYPTSPGTAG